MRNPFRYRPEMPVDPNDGETDEWEDNWLSNALAWASRVFTKNWCDTPEHWTSRISNYLWTSCPCCLFFRGAILGVILGVVSGALLVYTIVHLI
jgi:hypothetical protein